MHNNVCPSTVESGPGRFPPVDLSIRPFWNVINILLCTDGDTYGQTYKTVNYSMKLAENCVPTRNVAAIGKMGDIGDRSSSDNTLIVNLNENWFHISVFL